MFNTGEIHNKLLATEAVSRTENNDCFLKKAATNVNDLARKSVNICRKEN